MLVITPVQYEALATDALLWQLHRFLSERVLDAGSRALLTDQAGCAAFWRPLRDPARDDYVEALRLTVALAARARGDDPSAQLRTIDASADPDHCAKEILEAWGVVRYSEFDIE
jgi:hypothetical protein